MLYCLVATAAVGQGVMLLNPYITVETPKFSLPPTGPNVLGSRHFCQCPEKKWISWAGIAVT